MDETISITATNTVGKVPFVARIIRKGERYGLDRCLTWDDDRPGVEFYDGRHPHTSLGQFVSRYYVETLLESGQAGRGLDLMGYEPSWKIDASAMTIVRMWLTHQVGR